MTAVHVEDIYEKQESKFTGTYTEFKKKKIIWDDSKIPAYQALAARALSFPSSFWNTPETIPLLISLFSSLLVNCVQMVFDSKSRKTSSKQKSLRRLDQALQTLEKGRQTLIQN